MLLSFKISDTPEPVAVGCCDIFNTYRDGIFVQHVFQPVENSSLIGHVTNFGQITSWILILTPSGSSNWNPAELF